MRDKKQNTGQTFWLAVSLMALLAIGAATWTLVRLRSAEEQLTQTNQANSLAPLLGAQVPDFSLVDQNGNTVTLKELKGQVLVVDFFFTRCPGQCPMMTLRMRQLQQSIPKDADVKLVSISVDPEHDTPEELTKYAEQYGAEEGRWIFLTGEKQQIIQLATEGFRLSAGEDPNLHSLRLVLVDREGKIRGYYHPQDATSMDKLNRDLEALRKSSNRDPAETREKV